MLFYPKLLKNRAVGEGKEKNQFTILVNLECIVFSFALDTISVRYVGNFQNLHRCCDAPLSIVMTFIFSLYYGYSQIKVLA